MGLFLVIGLVCGVLRVPGALSDEKVNAMQDPQGIDLFLDTMKPIECIWNWEAIDMDALCPYSFDPFQFHEYVKAQVCDGILWMAKGSDVPAQLLCIESSSGQLLWEYSIEDSWNKDAPFVCLETSIIANFDGCAKVLTKENGEVVDQWDKQIAPFYISYVDSEWVVIQKIEQGNRSIAFVERDSNDITWSIIFSKDSNFRIIGIQNHVLYYFELVSGKVVLKGRPFDAEEADEITSWDTACRFDTLFEPEGLFIGILDTRGKASVICVTEAGSEARKNSFSDETLEQTFLVTTLLQGIDCSNGLDLDAIEIILEVENDAMGFRLIPMQENFCFAISASVEETDEAMDEDNTEQPIKEQLFVYCTKPNGDLVWYKQVDSLIETQGIVEDAFFQKDVLVFQYASKLSLEEKHYFAFWLDAYTGNMIQYMTHYGSSGNTEEISYHPIFFPYIVLQTSSLNSEYITSIQGFSCPEETLFREEQIPVSYDTVELEELCTEKISDHYQHHFLQPFLFQDMICFFEIDIQYSEKNIEIVLHQYDVVQKEFVPDKKMTLNGFNTLLSDLLLISDNIVVGSFSVDYKTSTICFDLSKQEIVWKKEAWLVDTIGTNLLLDSRHPQGKRSTFTVLNPLQDEVLQTFAFQTRNVDYIGCNSDGNILFCRDSIFISQFDIEEGILKEEILVSESELYNYLLLDHHLLFTYGGVVGCIDLLEKKLLWKRDMDHYALNFYDYGDYYRSPWKVAQINQKEVMIYDEHGSIVFDIERGVPVQKYTLSDDRIRNSCLMSSGEIVYVLTTENTGIQCLRINYQSPDQSELLQFTHIDFKGETNHFTDVYGFSIHREEYFVEYDLYGKNTISIQHYPMKATMASDSLDFVPAIADISNYLFISPYLIFQAMLGEKSNQFYLAAYNIEDGSMTKIHKGVHSRIFIDKEKLYFLQDDQYFCCDIGVFDTIEQIDYISATPAFSSTGDIEPVLDYQKGLPKKYAKLDLYYINAVHTGYFVHSDTLDTMFVTGDDVAVNIGIMIEEDGITVPGPSRSFHIEKDDQARISGLAFLQSMIFDIDQDGLEEMILLTKEYILVADYASDAEKMDLYVLPIDFEFGWNEELEILIQDGTVYFQYLYTEYGSQPKESMLHQFRLEYIPTSKEKYALSKCSISLDSSMYSHTYVNNLAPFQFLEKEASKENPYITLESTHCEAFPDTVMPCRYKMANEGMNELETAYCKQRNELLDQFLSLLEEGKDPFDGFEVEGIIYYSEVFYPISLAPSSEEEDVAQVTSILSFDLLKVENTKYILMRIQDEHEQIHDLLFSEDWSVLDSRSCLFYDQNEIAQIIVSENHPDYFWIQHFDQYDNPALLTFGRIVNNKMEFFVRRYKCELVLQDENTYFKVDKPNHFVMPMYIYGSRYLDDYELLYLDPFSGREVNGLFLQELMDSLDALYSLYSYYHSRCVTSGRYFPLFSDLQVLISKNRIKDLREAYEITGIYRTQRCLRKYGISVEESP